MSLKQRLQPLTTPAQVDAFLAVHPYCAIFKSGVCHKTEETFAFVEQALGPRPEIPVGLIKVVEWRPASNHVAALTGIRHESPQLILFKDGRAVFERNNWDINAEDIEEALAASFVPA